MKTRVVLFGMTGFGNEVFKSLMSMRGISVVAVITPPHPVGDFPYYKCNQLCDVAKKKVLLYEGLNLHSNDTLELIRHLNPDLMVVASFNQIIPMNIIWIPRLGTINVHPSLLPKYRGATPTTWAILNGEETTGVTFHFIESEKPDFGSWISQKEINISKNETDGTLRKKLALLAGKMVAKSIGRVVRGCKCCPQDERFASYNRKRTIEDSYMNTKSPIEKNNRLLRAMSPYPGMRCRLGESIIVLKSEKGHIVRMPL